eukprot:521660-Karenia_brevis.AAC.1
MITVKSHQCPYGLLSPGDDGMLRPAVKPTTWLTDVKEIVHEVSLRCTNSLLRKNQQHQHQELKGSVQGVPRTSLAERYPPRL